MNRIDRIHHLWNRTEEEIAVELGAKLKGFDSFEGVIGLTKEEANLLLHSGENILANRDFLGLSRQDFMNIWNKIRNAVQSCREKTDSYLVEMHQELYQIVCINLDLCRKLETYNSEIDLITAIAGALDTAIGNIPATEISVYIVKRGIKKFCGC
jgi:hypothetical protein